jgi:hypothetical protein
LMNGPCSVTTAICASVLPRRVHDTRGASDCNEAGRNGREGAQRRCVSRHA